MTHRPIGSSKKREPNLRLQTLPESSYDRAMVIAIAAMYDTEPTETFEQRAVLADKAAKMLGIRPIASRVRETTDTTGDPS